MKLSFFRRHQSLWLALMVSTLLLVSGGMAVASSAGSEHAAHGEAVAAGAEPSAHGEAVAAGHGEAEAEGHGEAAGGHGGGKHWLPTDTYKTMNFLVLAIGIFLLVRKPVPELLNNRIKGIRDQLAELEEKRQSAEKVLAEYEAKIAMLGQEEEKILKQYAEQAEEAKKRFEAEAAASAAKLEEQAKKNIEYEFKAARKLLRDEVIEEALAKAEERIRDSIGAEDQDRLVDEYLNKVVA